MISEAIKMNSTLSSLDLRGDEHEQGRTEENRINNDMKMYMNSKQYWRRRKNA